MQIPTGHKENELCLENEVMYISDIKHTYSYDKKVKTYMVINMACCRRTLVIASDAVFVNRALSINYECLTKPITGHTTLIKGGHWGLRVTVGRWGIIAHTAVFVKGENGRRLN